MALLSLRMGIALAITAQAVIGQYNDNPFAGGQNPMPAAQGGGGYFEDNPFANRVKQNHVPPAGHPDSAGGAGGGFYADDPGSGGGGYFQDNPFGSGGGQNQMPETGPATAGGGGGDGVFNDNPSAYPGNSFPSRQPGGNQAGSPSTDTGRYPHPGQCPGTFPSEEQILTDKPGCPAVRASEPRRIEDLSFELAPICPDHDGKLYQSRGGATFMVQCCSHGGGDTIRTVVAEDFRRCMSNCSATDECHSVQYTARDYGEPVGTCIMMKKGGFAKSACGVPDQHTYAFVVDPPAIDPVLQQQLTVKCSTECPFGHGQAFKTESGEIFQLTCGKRHGTKMIHRDNQASMMNCMNNCGNIMQCDSVDYDIHRNICYYSNHKAEPRTEASMFASAYSIGCGICEFERGTRCSCKLIGNRGRT